jgi:hypothetical protein
MKNIIAWIKANPISVASFAVMLLSTLVIFYFLFMANPALQERAAEQPGRDLTEIERYMRQSVEVPPANADDPPEFHSNVTINDDFIQKIGTIYRDLNRESEAIFNRALQINEPGHQQLIPNLFPNTPPGQRFRAQTVYVQALQGLMGDAQRAAQVFEATGLQIPYLNAARPLDRETLQRQLDETTAALDKQISAATSSEARMRQQRNEQQRQLVNLMLEHAQGISLYAETELGNAQNPVAGFPLQVAALGTTPTSPEPAQLWEGQLQLWILQDIVRAIALTNDVLNRRDNGTDEEGNAIPSSVLNNPIKRLIQLEVIPGYVGLHTMGGVDQITAGSSRSGGRSARGGSASLGPGGYPPPAGGMTDQERDVPVPDNFVYAPTGRSSNHLYDVRHVRLVMHADYGQLPAFFNTLADVNFMTVLNARVSAIDEYELLQQQFMYGQGDVVEVELIIETLWLREWTSALMPDPVKQYLGLLEPPTGAGTGQNFMDQGFQYDPSMMGPEMMGPGGGRGR